MFRAISESWDSERPPTVSPLPDAVAAKTASVARVDVLAAEAPGPHSRESVRRTLAKIEVTRRTKRRKGKPREAQVVSEKPVTVSEDATIRELADVFKVDATELVTKLTDLGTTATINQSLESETIELLAEDLRIAQLALSEITGEFTPDDLLGKLFSSFCIGK